MNANPKPTRLNIARLALVTALGIGLAIASGLQAFASISEARGQDSASGFRPWVGEAPAYDADHLLAGASDAKTMAAVRQLARDSLLAQAVNARAIRLLGLTEAAVGRQGVATDLVNLSTTLSRRDIGAQLWLINRYASTDDLGAALQHYDTALRTNAEVYATLFPVLTHGIENEQIQARFLTDIQPDAPWLGSFYDYAIAQSPHPEVFARMALRARGFPASVPPLKRERAVLAQLVGKGMFAEAHGLFAGLQGFDHRVASSTAFEGLGADGQSGVMGWQTFSTPAIGGSFVGGSAGAAARLQVFATSGERALVARKILYIKAGTYTFQPVYVDVGGAGGASASWQLQCLRAGAMTSEWIRDDKASVLLAQPIASATTIQPGCDAHYLDLNVAGGANQSGSQFSVASVLFKPR